MSQLDKGPKIYVSEYVGQFYQKPLFSKSIYLCWSSWPSNAVLHQTYRYTWFRPGIKTCWTNPVKWCWKCLMTLIQFQNFIRASFRKKGSRSIQTVLNEQKSVFIISIHTSLSAYESTLSESDVVKNDGFLYVSQFYVDSKKVNEKFLHRHYPLLKNHHLPN